MRRAEPEIRLWPGVPDLRALGARSFDDLMGTSGELEGEAQAQALPAPQDQVLLRYALPGTVHTPGVKRTSPRGAGTGYIQLRRWSAGSWNKRFGARFGSPRSTSFAAQAWNLYCHLRQCGVGTAQPLAMGQANAAFFAGQSFLVTRTLEPMQTLPEYLAEHTAASARRHLAQALGLFLHRIFQAGVVLPCLAPDQIYVSRLKEKPSCAIAKIAREVPSGVPESAGLSTSALPELALACVERGRILRSLDFEARLAQLKAWSVSLEAGWCTRDLWRVTRHALGADTTAQERRRALRLLQSHD